MIQCDMPCRRSTRPTANAMAPVVTASIDHSQSDVPATVNNSSALRHVERHGQQRHEPQLLVHRVEERDMLSCA